MQALFVIVSNSEAISKGDALFSGLLHACAPPTLQFAMTVAICGVASIPDSRGRLFLPCK